MINAARFLPDKLNRIMYYATTTNTKMTGPKIGVEGRLSLDKDGMRPLKQEYALTFGSQGMVDSMFSLSEWSCFPLVSTGRICDCGKLLTLSSLLLLQKSHQFSMYWRHSKSSSQSPQPLLILRRTDSGRAGRDVSENLGPEEEDRAGYAYCYERLNIKYYEDDSFKGLVELSNISLSIVFPVFELCLPA